MKGTRSVPRFIYIFINIISVESEIIILINNFKRQKKQKTKTKQCTESLQLCKLCYSKLFFGKEA